MRASHELTRLRRVPDKVVRSVQTGRGENSAGDPFGEGLHGGLERDRKNGFLSVVPYKTRNGRYYIETLGLFDLKNRPARGPKKSLPRRLGANKCSDLKTMRKGMKLMR